MTSDFSIVETVGTIIDDNGKPLTKPNGRIFVVYDEKGDFVGTSENKEIADAIASAEKNRRVKIHLTDPSP